MTETTPEAPPRVVLFDIDDTLLDQRGAAIGALAALLGDDDRFAGIDPTAAEDVWMRVEDEATAGMLRGEYGIDHQRVLRAQKFAAEYGVALTDPESSAFFERYLREVQARWRAFDDAVPTLRTLHAAGIRMGAITNGDAKHQQDKVDSLQCHEWLEHVVVSGSFGPAKPDPRIFRHAVELFGVDPDAAAYVGDRLTVDAIGAADAGLTGVWIDRELRDEPAEAFARADAVGVRRIRHLAELPGALGID